MTLCWNECGVKKGPVGARKYMPILNCLGQILAKTGTVQLGQKYPDWCLPGMGGFKSCNLLNVNKLVMLQHGILNKS